MRTEEACQAYWSTSRAWNGAEGAEELTYEQAQKRLLPLYVNHRHPSLALVRQAEGLSSALVMNKRKRKPRKLPKNVVQLPIAQPLKKVASA